MKRLLLVLTMLTMFLGGMGCSISHSTTIVRDVGRQAMLMESAQAPHMKGAALRTNDVQLSGSYGWTLKPQSQGQRVNGKSGEVTLTHMFDVRAAFALNEADDPMAPVWELGLNLGLAHNSFGKARAKDIQISNFEDIYIRTGIGFRGPVYRSDKVHLGLVFEVDFAFLPYEIDVVRNTNFTKDGFIIFPPFGAINYTVAFETEEQDHLSGRQFFPIFRGGFYGAYQFSEIWSLNGGFSVQNVPRVAGVVVNEYTCESTSLFDADDANDCRKSHDDFPFFDHAAAGTLFGSVNLTLDSLVISLRAQGHLAIDGKDIYAPPFGADIEVGYRF